jgi:hypothetical protein
MHTSIGKKGGLLTLALRMNIIHITVSVSHLDELGFDTEDKDISRRIYSRTMCSVDLRLEPPVHGRLLIVITPLGKLVVPLSPLAHGLHWYCAHY